jgi:hypothetical protein
LSPLPSGIAVSIVVDHLLQLPIVIAKSVVVVIVVIIKVGVVAVVGVVIAGVS